MLEKTFFTGETKWIQVKLELVKFRRQSHLFCLLPALDSSAGLCYTGEKRSVHEPLLPLSSCLQYDNVESCTAGVCDCGSFRAIGSLLKAF